MQNHWIIISFGLTEGDNSVKFKREELGRDKKTCLEKEISFGTILDHFVLSRYKFTSLRSSLDDLNPLLQMPCV